MLYNAKMQFYDHSLRIPMLFSGPGIKHGSQFDFLGTQVTNMIRTEASTEIPLHFYSFHLRFLLCLPRSTSRPPSPPGSCEAV
eukprot:COSAG01_NODE_1419_length_10368_cov_131.656344_7_plen_83_part_00